MTAYEQIVLAAQMRPLLHPYSDRCEVTLPTYRLEEMLAEKLRALLTRRRVRHFYDVWYLLKHYANQIDANTVVRVFADKCQYKQVPFGSPAEFFRPEALACLCRIVGEVTDSSTGRFARLCQRLQGVQALVENLFDRDSRGSARPTDGTQ